MNNKGTTIIDKGRTVQGLGGSWLGQGTDVRLMREKGPCALLCLNSIIEPIEPACNAYFH